MGAAQITLTLLPTTPTDTDTVTATATINAAATGTMQFTIDGTNSGSAVNIAGGTAVAALGKLTAGPHTIGAMYSGDGAFGSSSTSVQINVTSSSSAFTMSATNANVTSGQSATSTATVQSVSTYAGTVVLALTGSGPSNICYTIGANPTLTAGNSGSTAIKFFTGTGCLSPNAHHLGLRTTASLPHTSSLKATYAFAFAGVLLLFTRRRKQLRAAALALFALSAFGLISGCGGKSTTPPATTGGSYTLTLTGTDSANSTNHASTTFTLTQ